MGKTIVNKSYKNKEDITRQSFSEDRDLANGEIVILNDREPSIYVLNSIGEPKQILGINDEFVNSLKDEIAVLYQEADTELYNSLINANDSFKIEIKASLGNLQKEYKASDTAIDIKIDETKENILNHTINNKTLSTNPNLTAEDIQLIDFSNVNLDGQGEFIENNDSTQMAFKKLENVILVNALAFSASINDINDKTKNKFNNIEAQDGKLILLPNCLNISNILEGEIIIELQENKMTENSYNAYELLINTGNDFDIVLPDTISYTNMQLNELKINTTYLFRFRYNFLEITEFYSL